MNRLQRFSLRHSSQIHTDRQSSKTLQYRWCHHMRSIQSHTHIFTTMNINAKPIIQDAQQDNSDCNPSCLPKTKAVLHNCYAFHRVLSIGLGNDASLHIDNNDNNESVQTNLAISTSKPRRHEQPQQAMTSCDAAWR